MGIGEEKEQVYTAEFVEEKCVEAFMDGYKYAIRMLQDALVQMEKTE